MSTREAGSFAAKWKTTRSSDRRHRTVPVERSETQQFAHWHEDPRELQSLATDVPGQIFLPQVRPRPNQSRIQEALAVRRAALWRSSPSTVTSSRRASSRGRERPDAFCSCRLICSSCDCACSARCSAAAANCTSLSARAPLPAAFSAARAGGIAACARANANASWTVLAEIWRRASAEIVSPVSVADSIAEVQGYRCQVTVWLRYFRMVVVRNRPLRLEYRN